MRLPLALVLALAAAPVAAQTPAGEEPVPPYVVSNANAGATPLRDLRTFEAFGGKPGIDRVVADLIARSQADPRLTDIFQGGDMVRLQRTLSEQLCYLLGGPCGYTGRTMDEAHRDMGLQQADFNALVEALQKAMDANGVPFRAQNRLLAKLAPMHRDVVDR